MAFALFIVYVALSYIHPGEIVPELAPYRFAYWVGAAALAAALASVLVRRGTLVANVQLWVLIAFAAVSGVSLMIAENWLGAPLATLQRFGPSLTIFVLAVCNVTSLARLRVAAICIIVLTLALMLQGAAAYHFGYNARMFLLDQSRRIDETGVSTADEQVEPDAFDRAPDDSLVDDDDDAPDEPRIRGLGTMNDPNDLALGMIVALGLVGGAWKPRLRLRELLLGVAAGALVYGIYLTRSRGGVVALLVVLWRFAATRLGRIPAFVLVAALGAAALAHDFGGRQLSVDLDESASGRLVAWTEGFEMLKAQPLLGIGFGQFLDHHTLTAHNSLVLCFAETGLLGCFLWVGLLVVTLIELHRVKHLPGVEPFDEAARQWADGLQLSLVGFIAAAFFLSRTFVPTLYLVVGLSAALAAIARAAGRSISLPPLPQLGTLVLACEIGGIAVVYTIVKLIAA
jgi:hypothetical protein